MKDRIKKFYEEHKTACNVVVSVGAVLGTVMLVNKTRGYQAVSADVFKNNDGDVKLFVNQRNGKSIAFEGTFGGDS